MKTQVDRALNAELSVDELSVDEQSAYLQGMRKKLLNPDPELAQSIASKLARGTQFEISSTGEPIERDPDGTLRLISYVDGRRIEQTLSDEKARHLLKTLRQ